MYYSRNKFFVNIFLKNVKISSGLPQTKRQLCTAASRRARQKRAGVIPEDISARKKFLIQHSGVPQVMRQHYTTTFDLPYYTLYFFRSASSTNGGTISDIFPPNLASSFIELDFSRRYF